jgi:predicted transcriptional regulator
MLTVETIGRIRREHFLKGKTIREIARDLRVSRNTVRKVLRSGATSAEYERDVQPRPKLGRWTADTTSLLPSLRGDAAVLGAQTKTLTKIKEGAMRARVLISSERRFIQFGASADLLCFAFPVPHLLADEGLLAF